MDRRRAPGRVARLLALAGLMLVEGLPLRAQDPIPPPAPPEPEAPAGGRPAPPSFVEGLAKDASRIEVKLGHGKVLTLERDLFAGANGAPSIAVGDPGVLDFAAISTRQIRLLGNRLGATDLAITTADGRTTTYEILVVPDLDLLRGQLRQAFPDALVTLGQVGDHLVVEGQARDGAQVTQIMQVLQNAVASSTGAPPGSDAPAAAAGGVMPPIPPAPGAVNAQGTGIGMAMGMGPAVPTVGGAEAPQAVRILNLLRVPGSQQVLLKVRVAELNRTAFRQIGANVLGYDAKSGSIFGTQIGNPVTATGGMSPVNVNRSRSFTNGSGANSVGATAPSAAAGLIGSATSTLTTAGTVFGIFQNSNFDVFLNALRKNAILKILAEPNLMAMNGHKASFVAGGEFPVPVASSTGSGNLAFNVVFKEFGVRLDFLPTILDGDVIRLTVDPEVSSIDNSIAVSIINGGSPIPGLNTRKAHTTVELRQGQTLAIAGLMQLSLDGQTARIPGLGDLPILGPFFSNTTSNRVEKELVVLVTPYLVGPMDAGQIPPGPGDEVGAPNDLEFYFLNRIEGRTGRDFRAATDGADPLRIGRLLRLERKYVRGPVGFSD